MRFLCVTWHSRLPIAAASLLLSCSGATRNADPVIGSSLSSADNSSYESRPASTKPPPAPNLSLSEGAPTKTISAYEYLLVTTTLALGVQCGPELGSTDAWRALSVLVQDSRSAMLWDLSARATATESRAAAIVGLAKLRTISQADGRDLLRHMPGTIMICEGTDLAKTRPESATEFLAHPLEGESTRLSVP